MKGFFVFLLSIMFCYAASGQTDSFFNVNGIDTIQISRKMGNSPRFFYHGERLTMGDIKFIVKDDFDASRFIRGAQAQKALANVLMGVGVVGMAIPLTLSINGASGLPWYSAAAGAVVVAVSIPVRIAAHGTATNAVKLYNKGIKDKRTVGRYKLKLESTRNTVGLALSL